LYYAIGTVSDPVNGNPSSLPTGLTDLGVFTGYDNSGGAVGAPGLGYFDGATVQIPGYTTGPITFEIVAFNGSSYTSADTTFRGRSGSFTESSIQTLGNPVTILGDNTIGGQPAFSVASVAPVPEPTTLALAGLGGLASLVALRRKQA
jgi:PEP-CTERM motif